MAIYGKQGAPGQAIVAVSTGATRVPVDEGYYNEIAQISQTMISLASGDVMGTDLLLTPEGKLVFLEINTIPGFDPDRADIADGWIDTLLHRYA